MHHTQYRWLGVLLMAGLNVPGALWAAEPVDSQQHERIQHLFDLAFESPEGQRRYEQWRSSDDLPPRALLATAGEDVPPSPPVPVPTPAPSVSHPAQPSDYFLTDGDILKISVWQWPDLEQEVIIRPDGKISFPLVGDVTARGLTVSQLDAVLTEELKRFIRAPQVSIAIKGFGGHKIVVLGEVKSPGVYLLGGIPTALGSSTVPARQATLLEAVSQAGGFTSAAKLKSIIILRGPVDQPEIKLIDIYRTTRGKVRNLRANIPVYPNDIIYVPRTVMTDVKDVTTTLVPIINSVFQTIIGYEQLTDENN